MYKSYDLVIRFIGFIKEGPSTFSKMKFLFFVIFLLTVSYACADQLDVKICNKKQTNQYVDNIDLAIDPNPILIAPSVTIRFHFGIDILKDIPNGSSLKLKITKKGLIPVHIPCLEVSHFLKHE